MRLVGDSEAVTNSSAAVVGRVVIVGVGLMGGSLGLALIEQNAAEEIIGIDSLEVLETALRASAIHRAGVNLEMAIPSADLVVLAAPVHAISGLLRQIAPLVAEHATVSDLASVKSSIVTEGERLLGDRFVGGHPMAGSEQTGIRSARSTLFQQAPWALTPSNPNHFTTPHVELLCRLARRVGALPLLMAPQEHDRAAALISHLPHLICYAYNKTVHTSPDAANGLALAAGSYRDLTRVAASDPVLWRDVFMENREYLLETLRAYQDSLSQLETAIMSERPEQILAAILIAGSRG